MKISRIKEAWQLVNEPLEHPERLEVQGRPLSRLFKQSYLKSFKGSVLTIIIASAVTGLWVFAYAFAARIVADDVIEVGIQAPHTPAAKSDPAKPGEHREFTMDDAHERTSLDAQIEARPGRTVAQKMKLLGWVGLMLLINEVIRHASWSIMAVQSISVGQHVTFYLRQQLHDKLQQLPLSYHDRHSPGRLLTHLFSDVSAIETGIKTLLQNIPPYALNIVLGTGLVLFLNAKLGLLVLVALPAYWVVYQWFYKRLQVVNENLREREGRLNAHISNRVSNFQVVKSFVRESSESLDFLRRNRPIIRNTLAATMLNTGFVAACGIITGVCTTLILWFGTLQVRDGRMTLGELLMFYGSAGYLFTPIAVLTNLAGVFHRTRAVAGKILRVLDEPIDLADPEEPVPVPTSACEIKLDNVTLLYDAARAPALQNVSLTIPAGKRLCVMGPSGSGKSSLAKVIGRLYDPTQGAVMFDGIDLRQFKVSELRKMIGFVSQEPVVFSGTIADNIRYGSAHAHQDAVVRAAQYAQIHDFINRLPDRYLTLTHERGLTLSGGQKQRVNLARALLYDPRVLVLDDCTSALDADTEAKLVQSFQTALQNRTAVLVSHRVSIALGCDLVAMLDGGKLVEFGPPQTLLQSGGAFSHVFREQMKKGRVA